MVGATGFEPATTCTPTAARGFTRRRTASMGALPVEKTGPSKRAGSDSVSQIPPNMTPVPAPVLRPGERFLTPADVAAALQVSRATVYALIERGELRARRVGLHLRVLAADLDSLCADHVTGLWGSASALGVTGLLGRSQRRSSAVGRAGFDPVRRTSQPRHVARVTGMVTCDLGPPSSFLLLGARRLERAVPCRCDRDRHALTPASHWSRVLGREDEPIRSAKHGWPATCNWARHDAAPASGVRRPTRRH
jgi:excisionase family DNA binding protein